MATTNYGSKAKGKVRAEKHDKACLCWRCRNAFFSKIKGREAREKAATAEDIRTWKETAQQEYDDDFAGFADDLADQISSAIYEKVGDVLYALRAKGRAFTFEEIADALEKADPQDLIAVIRKKNHVAVKVGKARPTFAPTFPDYRDCY